MEIKLASHQFLPECFSTFLWWCISRVKREKIPSFSFPTQVRFLRIWLLCHLVDSTLQFGLHVYLSRTWVSGFVQSIRRMHTYTGRALVHSLIQKSLETTTPTEGTELLTQQQLASFNPSHYQMRSALLTAGKQGGIATNLISESPREKAPSKNCKQNLLIPPPTFLPPPPPPLIPPPPPLHLPHTCILPFLCSRKKVDSAWTDKAFKLVWGNWTFHVYSLKVRTR